MTSPFRRSVTEHQAIIKELVDQALGKPPSETVELRNAFGRKLVQPLSAPRSLPPWDNSQMDGYAVNTDDFGVGALKVAPAIAAGESAPALERGHAAPIMTGAPMPHGANAVVPIEAATPDSFPTASQITAGATVQLPDTYSPGTFIRTRGSDIAEGATVLAAGTRLGPTSLGILAGLGISQVNVAQRPAILLLSTGDELVAPGGELHPGQIHDANTTLLTTALEAAGCHVTNVGVLDDSPERFTTSLTNVLTTGERPYDLVISSGGISKGAFDVVKEVLASHGISFGSVAMQPGGPQGNGTLSLPGCDPVAFIAFPGNPVSAYVSYEIFLRPALAKTLDLAPRPLIEATLSEPLESMPGKLQVRRGTYADGTFTPLGGSSSHLLAALAASNSLILIDEDTTALGAGQKVQTLVIGDGS